MYFREQQHAVMQNSNSIYGFLLSDNNNLEFGEEYYMKIDTFQLLYFEWCRKHHARRLSIDPTACSRPFRAKGMSFTGEN